MAFERKQYRYNEEAALRAHCIMRLASERKEELIRAASDNGTFPCFTSPYTFLYTTNVVRTGRYSQVEFVTSDIHP